MISLSRLHALDKTCLKTPSLLPYQVVLDIFHRTYRNHPISSRNKDQKHFALAISLSIGQQERNRKIYRVQFSCPLNPCQVNGWYDVLALIFTYLCPNSMITFLPFRYFYCSTKIFEFLEFHDDIEIPFSLHSIIDTRQIEILIEEINTYCIPQFNFNSTDTFKYHARKASNALVFQYLSFLHNHQILWLITIQTIYHVYNSSNVS